MNFSSYLKQREYQLPLFHGKGLERKVRNGIFNKP